MIENPPSAGFLLPAIYGGNLSGAQIKLGAAHGRDYRFAGMARSYGNAVHFRSHAFYSPLPFMGEGLGVRAENTAKLEAFPCPRRGEGMIASTRCLSQQHYEIGRAHVSTPLTLK